MGRRKVSLRRTSAGQVSGRFATRLSRSHFLRRRHVGGVRGLARSRRLSASRDRLRAVRQAVVVTVGGKTGPGPARRLPGTVEHHRGGEPRRRDRRGKRRKSEMVGAMGFEPMTFCTPSKRATSLRYAPKFVTVTLLSGVIACASRWWGSSFDSVG